MDRSGAGAGFLRELRFPLPIYIPSASPQSSSLSPEAVKIGQEGPQCQHPHKPNNNNNNIEHLQNVTTNNYDSLTELHSKDHRSYRTDEVFSDFTTRCLVSASSHGHSPSSGFPNCPRPQHNCTSQMTQQLNVRVTLRPAVYRQSVRLGDKPLETHGTVILFSN
jgi:hypothetical protein